MSGVRISEPARRVLADGALCHLAVRTSNGPHVTPVVYVADGGRLWFTTARRSVKARAWRTDAHASGLVRAGGAAVTFRGEVRTYDALDPDTWARMAAGAPRLMRAGTRFSLKNARFFAGYAVDAGKVPLAWTPPGRVFASVRPDAVALVEGSDGAPASWGPWPDGFESRKSFGEAKPASSSPPALPSTVRTLVGEWGTGVVAFDGSAGLTVVPGRWRLGPSGLYEAVVSRDAARLTGAGPVSPAALVADRASTWRAADMAGILAMGRAEIFDPRAVTRGKAALARALEGDGDGVLVRLRPTRLVWWEGWASGTVPVA